MKRSRQSEGGLESKKLKNSSDEENAVSKTDNTVSTPDVVKDIATKPSKEASEEAAIKPQEPVSKNNGNDEAGTTETTPTASNTAPSELKDTDKPAVLATKENEGKSEKPEQTEESLNTNTSEQQLPPADVSEPAPTSENRESKDSAEPPKQASPKPFGFSSFGSGFSGFSGFSSNSKFKSLSKSENSNPWAEPAKPQSSTSNGEDKKSSEIGKEASADSTADNEEATGSDVTGTTSSTTAKDRDNTKADGNNTASQFKMGPQKVKTGEEDEETVYSVRVRLYAFDLTNTEQKSWKERGTGLLKLNKSEESGKYRLVMRADSVLRVSLNIPLIPNMQVTKGFATSLHTEKFVQFAGIDDGKAHQFAVKCSSEAQRNELYDAIVNVLQK